MEKAGFPWAVFVRVRILFSKKDKRKATFLEPVVSLSKSGQRITALFNPGDYRKEMTVDQYV